MNLDNVNKWLTLVANFGVVAGIVFLAVEVRQNQEVLERDHAIALLDSASLEVSRYTAQRELRIQSREITQLWMDGLAGKDLDPVDQSRFNSMCSNETWSDALLYERSVALGRIVWEKAIVESNKRGLEENPGFKACWERRRETLKGWGYEDFVNKVDSQ
jgi:hypothetical protein